MTPALRSWVMLPSRWIDEGGLKDFRWVHGRGPGSVAALMVLIVIVHHADKHTGSTVLTYDALTERTGLSRAKVAEGLSILKERRLIACGAEDRSTYNLAGYTPYEGWAKLPARGLYNGGRVWAFDDFHLRKPAELDALKLYLLFAARRDNESNLAKISYEKITDYSGVPKNNIKRALSFLAVEGLVHVERLPSAMSQMGVVNAYRLAFLDSRKHMGTTGRSGIAADGSNPDALPF